MDDAQFWDMMSLDEDPAFLSFFINSFDSSRPVISMNDNNATTENDVGGGYDQIVVNERNHESPKEGCVEVALTSSRRRGRGRPKGSKNKLKAAPAMPTELEKHAVMIADGEDIGGYVAELCRRHGKGVCILSGSGVVKNATLQLPLPGGLKVLEGCFQILSLNGTFWPRQGQSMRLAIHLAEREGAGQAVGGWVVGPLVASGPILVVATFFSNIIHEKLGTENPTVPVAGGEQQRAWSTGETSSFDTAAVGCNLHCIGMYWE